jgi:hypothetical protein
MNLLLCGLGAYFFVLVLKTVVFLKRPNPWVGLILALVGSTAVSVVFYRHQLLTLVVYAVAGAGLSVGIHRLFRVLHALGDQSMIWSLRNGRRG